MIHFHGGPITPDTCALKAWKGRHAFISFANPGQLTLASEVTQSFALDNGARRMKALITRELMAPFLLLAFTFDRINQQFRDHP